ncbi:hypothetical protein LT337_32185 (plasmid) [Mycolicibacterium fortuitum]|uniref:hypothetical protein n=1 Tax=Mycolicibacterium conceptionense TaxID=451644 RepID=UPI003204B4E6|nr:hypothetical protein LT337_32185 [Mycolicibacterium fortuitum]
MAELANVLVEIGVLAVPSDSLCDQLTQQLVRTQFQDETQRGEFVDLVLTDQTVSDLQFAPGSHQKSAPVVVAGESGLPGNMVRAREGLVRLRR